jgi:hypothetical protein
MIISSYTLGSQSPIGIGVKYVQKMHHISHENYRPIASASKGPMWLCTNTNNILFFGNILIYHSPLSLVHIVSGKDPLLEAACIFPPSFLAFLLFVLKYL